MKKGRFDLYIREDFVEIKNLVSKFTSVMLQISEISLTKSLWSEYVKISYKKMCTVERKRPVIKCPLIYILFYQVRSYFQAILCTKD